MKPTSALIYSAALLLVIVGCNRGPQMTPVTGTVTFKGSPLQYGSVMFQPAGGQPASGVIQPDGSFSLSTYATGDGALVGHHQVRITCYQGQSPTAHNGGGEGALGSSLIPERYTRLVTSGLDAEVTNDCPPFQFDLTE